MLDMLCFIASSGTDTLLRIANVRIADTWRRNRLAGYTPLCGDGDDADSADSTDDYEDSQVRPTTQMVLRALCQQQGGEAATRALHCALSYAMRNLADMNLCTYGDLDVVPPSPVPTTATDDDVRVLRYVLRALERFELQVAASRAAVFRPWFEDAATSPAASPAASAAAAAAAAASAAHLYAKYRECGDPRSCDHSVVFYSRLDAANKHHFISHIAHEP